MFFACRQLHIRNINRVVCTVGEISECCMQSVQFTSFAHNARASELRYPEVISSLNKA